VIDPVLKRITFQNPETDEGHGSSRIFHHLRFNLDKSNNTESLLRLYLEKRQDEEEIKQCDAPLAVEALIRGGR
jgi:hypothetical protein